MSKYISVAVVLVVIGVSGVLLAQSSQRAADLQTRVDKLEHERADLQERLRPYEAKRRASFQLNQEINIAAGTIQRYPFSPAMVPGTLSGTWRASGQGYGGADDTIAALRLTDPRDGLLYSSGRASSGSFLVKLSASGSYTFYFDNSGLFRSTPRRVILDAEFKPD